jgi:UDP-glucose 4-epimerase
MTVLATGGAGYIGSHVVVALLDAGRDVLIADDFSNARRDVVDRIAAAAGGRRPRVVEVDIADRAALRRELADEPIDAVIHLAGLKSVAESARAPLDYHRVNVAGTVYVREIAGDVPFVYSSSASVYGTPWRCPVEEHDPCAPVSVYGFTKYAAERALQAASAAAGGSPLAILRYFNPAGAHPSAWIGEDPTGATHNLMPRIEQVAVGALPSLTLHGCDYPTRDGTAIRDYVHVVDLAEAHVRALEALEARRTSFVVNLGSSRGHTVRELIAAFEAATGRRIAVVAGPRREGDVAELWAHAGRAADLLGWRARRSVVQMCEDALRWRHARAARLTEGPRRRAVAGEAMTL